jgi:hypothetical protein
VVAKTDDVLASDLEQAGLLDLGQGAGRAADGGGESGHEDPPVVGGVDDTDALNAKKSKSKESGSPTGSVDETEKHRG